MKHAVSLIVLLYSSLIASTCAFGTEYDVSLLRTRTTANWRMLTATTTTKQASVSSALYGTTSTPTTTTSPVDMRRRVLLGRKGPYFSLDRSDGQIEFGATARLVTELDEQDRSNLIADWLRDEQSFAMSIWQEDLIEKKEDSIYRLQLMTLKFVTIELSPWVDLRMKTVSDSQGMPVFTLQSINFDPNIQVLPGMRISAESLGIVIEVAGQLRGTSDGKGVSGSIAFQTTGKLPGPLRILPQGALKAASDTINETVVNFAVKSFQKGARDNYQKYLQKKK